MNKAFTLLLAALPAIMASEVCANGNSSTLSVEFPKATETVTYGSSLLLEGTVSGGVAPYTYEWYAQDGTLLGKDASQNIQPETPGYITLTVTSSDGQTVSSRVAVEVSGAPLQVATFDDNALAEESHFTPQGDGKFYSGSFAFNYGGMPEYNFWYGYTLSNETSTDFTGLQDQFRSAPGGGYNSSNFAVGYPQGLTISPVGFENGAVIPGFYVTNSAYAYTSMLNGDSFAKKFEQGDWFKLTAVITGVDDTESTVDLMYLADMRDENALEHYILHDWEYVDLSQYGPIKSIYFNFDGSDKGQWGLNTPTYLCIEDFGTLPYGDEISLKVAENGLDLKGYFHIEADGTRTDYSCRQLSGEESLLVSLDQDGRIYLTKSARTDEEASPSASATALVSMRQKGRTQHLYLTLTEDELSGIRNIDDTTEDLMVEAYGTTLRVNTAMTDYSVEVYTTSGVCTHSSAYHNGPITVDGDFAPGIYIVKVASDSRSEVKRVLIK